MVISIATVPLGVRLALTQSSTGVSFARYCKIILADKIAVNRPVHGIMRAHGSARVPCELQPPEMRTLITGASGFSGSHLAEHLAANTHDELYGCGLAGKMPADLSAAINYECIDLCDAGAVGAYIARIRPTAIYHLAGQAAVHASWGDPWAWFQGNVQSQVNMLEAARQLQPHPRIVVVTSGQVYGSVASGKPLTDEDRELRPDTPYGTSKAAQDWLAQQAFVHYGLPIIRLRPFNHIGPRQTGDFVATSFARQLVRIAAGQQPARVLVGNLAMQQDFTDVRDMARAYHLAWQHCAAGEAYNIASGSRYPVQQLLDELLRLTGLQVEVTVDPALYRPTTGAGLLPDTRKFTKLTGWQPAYNLTQTLDSLLQHERSLLQSVALSAPK